MHTSPHFAHAHFLDMIDWQQPWLAPLQACAAQIATSEWRSGVNALASKRTVCNQHGLPITFVPQAALPAATAYEAHISATGLVPTRENLHDFFNALIWLSFPLSKAALNGLQAMELSRAGTASGSGKPRGVARDAATIFDENAALLVVRTGAAGMALIAALREHQWSEVFTAQRDIFGADGDAQLWLFGHALIEKLVHPYKAITAHTLIMPMPDDFFAQDLSARRTWLDRDLAAHLSRQGMRIGQLTPLPVLGIPGWHPDQSAEFYSDVTVFRPKRKPMLPS